ncbi:MAG TPA: transglutaminase-like cysteine peptidase [Stellaceae bacterium]|nr:transglutaminase-like cysteine peptidase [Stellaceae bacterium]
MRVIRSLALLAAAAFAMPPAVSDAVAGASAAAVQAAYPGARQVPLFGTREIYSPDITAFDKWTGMLARFRLEQAACTAEAACEPGEWRRLLGALDGLGLRAKLDLVNAAVNRHPYVPSQSNWGENNHWETPFEFLRNSGQCQDYAITKYLLLRAAGVPAAQLRVLVLRDTQLGLDHAVTIAYVEGEALLLDNQIGAVVPADSVHHYQPYYSINEAGWWLHVGPNARYASAADGALR